MRKFSLLNHFKTLLVNKSIGSILVALFLTVDVHAQIAQNDLEQFYYSSYHPPELNVSSADRVNDLFQYYSTKNNIKSRLKKSEYEGFVYRSNYFLEKLNKSGQVFYGDTISAYLNKLKDYLLEGNERQKDIRVYLTRNPAFNAFTNDFGNVYVNVSALTVVQSESQLLGLLAHELNHVLNRHTHEFEEFRKQFEKGDWRGSAEQKVLDQHAFNQDQEYEADKEGFKLLYDRGIDCSEALKLFDLLRYDLNPHLTGYADLNLLSAGNPDIKSFYLDALDSISYVFKRVRENENDTVRTHPKTIDRKREIASYIKEFKDNPSYTETGEFNYISKLSSYVLINSFLENGWYIECLDHILKLRSQYPDDEYLIVSQSKALLLITQGKYNGSPFKQLINDKGNAYSDSAFLSFKEMFLSLNATELNMAAIISNRELKKQSNAAYLDRIHQYLVKFLYKYNEGLFTIKDGQLALIDAKDLNESSIKVNMLKPEYNLAGDRLKYYDELVYDKGYIKVKVRPAEESSDIANYFLANYSFSSDDKKSIADYKDQRNRFEQMLTIDQATVHLNPFYALIFNRAGKYERAKTYQTLDSVALVQSSNVYLDNRGRETELDFKESLELEKMMIEVLQENDVIDKNYSNSAVSFLTMSDINNHYYLLKWIQERFVFNDLIYSAVDQQVESIKKSGEIRYLLYNINGRSKSGGLSGRHITYSYNMYFDLQNEGLSYLSKIASKHKGNKLIFKQLFHLSNHNM